MERRPYKSLTSIIRAVLKESQTESASASNVPVIDADSTPEVEPAEETDEDNQARTVPTADLEARGHGKVEAELGRSRALRVAKMYRIDNA